MTNFKKTLAITLATSMVLSMSAFAGFSDADEIISTEAVDTLVALNIIKGYEDGSFKPTKEVTRAEMAKMIYTIQNDGNDDATAFENINSSFTDINGHWAEGYIKFGQSQGIIAGYSDTTFAPDATVKGTEALKMALVLLGYDANHAELVGSKWENNTLVLSTSAGLTTDFNGSFGLAADRNDAAQILFNALYADTVRYSNSYEDFEKTGLTLAEDTMNVKSFENAIITDSDIDGGLSYTIDGNSGNLDSDKDFTAYIGQKVEILADSKNNDVYGIRPYSDNDIINALAGEIEITGATGAKVAEYKNIEISISDDNATAILSAEPNADVNIVDNGTSVLVDITEVIAGEVTYVNDDKIHVSATGFTSGELTFEDDVIPSDIEKEDFVQIKNNDFTNNQDVLVLEQKTGTVDASTDVDYRVNGEWVYLAAGSDAPALGDEISYFQVGNVIYNIETKSNVSSTDYAFVIEAEASTSFVADHKAKILLADGTEKVVSTTEDETANKGNIVSYEIDEDGNYEFGTVTSELTNTVPVGNIFVDSTNRLAGEYVNDDALVFVKHSSDDFSVLTGAEVNAWSDVDTASSVSNAVLYTDDVNGIDYVKLAFVDLGESDLPNATSDLSYGYVVENSYKTTIDGDDFTIVNVFNGTEETEIKVKGFANSFVKGDYVSFGLNGDVSDDMEKLTGLTLDKVVGYSESNGIIEFDGATAEASDDVTADITEDSVIIYVNSEDKVGVESGSISLAEDLDGDDVIDANVRVLLKDGEVTVIFVDVNNDMQ